MAHIQSRARDMGFLRLGGLFGAIAFALVAGGCAQVGVPDMAGLMASAPHGQSGAPGASPVANAEQGLREATAYWGQKFQSNPSDLDSAINYAMNLKAMGRKRQALAVLQRSSVFHGDSRRLASEYGRLALSLGQVTVAEKVLALADDPADPDWRVLSARGAVLAKKGQYSAAIPYFTRALDYGPNQPSVLNNLALAHAMNGDPQQAEQILRTAAAQTGSSKKIRQNLALVLGLQGKYDEATQVSAQDVSRAQANADTRVIRRVVRLEPKAAPAPMPAASTQIAGALKPSTNTADTSADGWGSQVTVSSAQQ